MNNANVVYKELTYLGHYGNPNKFTEWYSKDKKTHAWCGMFQDYVVKKDMGLNWFDDCSNFAYVPTIVSWGKKKGWYDTNYKNAKEGDLVIYNWYPEKKNHYSHVEMVTEVKGNNVVSIGGNTDKGVLKNNVTKKSRNKKYVAGIVHLPYTQFELTRKLEKGCKGDDVKLLQKELKIRGYDLGKSGSNKDGIDGDFGKNTAKAVKKYQKDTKCKKVDEVVGKETATKLGWKWTPKKK